MKTELITMPDASEIWKELDLSGAPGEQETDAEVLRSLSRGRVTFEPKNAPIDLGDRVTISTSSALRKYNREKTVLIAGSGLYDKTIEELLIGMSVGESGCARIKGERVDFSVKLIERRAYPELTDGLVREQGIDGIDTLAQFREYTASRLRHEYVSRVAGELIEALLNRADIPDPDPDDVRAVIDREYEPLRARFLTGGVDLDTFSDDEWRENLYNPGLKAYYEQIYPDVAMLLDTTDKASFYANRTAQARGTIRHSLILRELTGEHGEDTDPTRSLHAEDKLRAELEAHIYNAIYGNEKE